MSTKLMAHRRSPVRYCPSGLRNRPYFVGRALPCHRLDYTPNSDKRQDERTKLIYRDDESLLWCYRTGDRVTLSILVCIRRSVTHLRTTIPKIYIPFPGMCAFGIIIGEFRPLTNGNTSEIQGRRHNPTCPPLLNSSAQGYIPHQSPIHHRPMHDVYLLPVVALPGHLKTRTGIGLCAGRDGYHRYISNCAKRARRTRTTGRPHHAVHIHQSGHLPSNRSYLLRVRVPPQQPTHLW